MTREEFTKEFNSLPKKARTIIIANELEMEIRWLEREKKEYIKEHKSKLAKLNNRIYSTEKRLKNIKIEN
jgi:CRISPR/Cas system CMR-associated protein Cmr5 small subunit